MKTPKILFIQGGWDGHKPEHIVHKFTSALSGCGCKTETITALERLADTEWLKTLDVISPCWTCGKLSKEESVGLRDAVRAGVGLGGVHGWMGDAFRGDLDYEWMVGGHFVGHPHVGDYTVKVTSPEDPIMQGLSSEFSYKSEQYYMLMDPGVRVLAEADCTFKERTCTMPVLWTKY